MVEEPVKVLNHPVVHDEVSHQDRLIFFVVGVIVTLAVFYFMGLL
ncbi:MAG: hypothetical protein RTV31_15205 [Candidatus Thorarchaeota archaeon]